MEVMLVLGTILLSLIALDVLSLRFGVDSRFDGEIRTPRAAL